jgi:uncharacterized protein
MSALADRLRAIVAAVPGSCQPAARREYPAVGEPALARAEVGPIADVLDGEWLDGDIGRILVVERRYRPGHRHGHVVVMDHLLPSGAAWRRVLLGTAAGDASVEETRRTLFIDLETTGLAGGAGSYAFLVGVGWFDDAVFVVRQFVLATFDAERAMLQALAHLSRACTLLVSYNGKSFDLPLMQTRFALNRMTAAFDDVPHLDMLHTARRLWREAETASRLVAFERMLCGFGREGDVPGFEIPGRYFHFVRTGDPRPLAGVLEHNRLDLLTLALLTSRAARLVEGGPCAARSATEAVGLGRIYERAGMQPEARSCYARAAGLDGHVPLPGDSRSLAESLRGYAVLCRRQRCYREAADAWQRLLDMPDCPPQTLREAAEALAVHHEHRLRNPHAAHVFAMRSLPLQGTAARRAALQHRVARLDRKLMGTALF